MMRLRILAACTLAAPVLAYAQAAPTAPAKAAAPAAKPAPAKAAAGACGKVKFTTTQGPIVVALDAEKAPLTVANFTAYVKAGQYNGTIFHRVIDGFMIQAGGYTKDLREKPTQPPVKNEGANGLKNEKYTIAMARTNVRDSATSQFFINVADNVSLDYSGETPQGWGYAVFGKVVEGKETVDKIRAIPTAAPNPMFANMPVETVTIEKAECSA